jgi:hypothetical protein
MYMMMTVTANARRKKMTTTSTILRQSRSDITHKIICIAAAAAFTTSTTTQAWLIKKDIGSSSHHRRNAQSQQPQRFATPYTMTPSSLLPSPLLSPFEEATIKTPTSVTRLYSSSSNIRQSSRGGVGGGNNNKNDNDNEEFEDEGDKKGRFGFRRAVKRVARKVLPTKWFRSKKEKLEIERKKQVKNKIQGELNDLLKGAPLPIRTFVKYAVAPMLGKLASKVAEGVEAQRKTMEKILDDTRSYLLNDDEITNLLGVPIQLGTPFAQSSSSASINGRRQTRIEFSSEVSGPKNNGVVRVIATGEGIGQLLVESTGKIYNIDLSSKGGGRKKKKKVGRGSSSPKSNWNNDEGQIIDAEIVDKTESTK